MKLALGTLEVTFEWTDTDITTRFEYSQDAFWRSYDNWRNEWRTVFPVGDKQLNLVPRCPPRNIVARPARDLYLPAATSMTVFIGYPAWVQVTTQNDVVVADLATELMSETWLGPNTREGELAFATQTQARLSRENLPPSAHIIRVPVQINNTSRNRLNISRLSIPAPELPTYKSNDQLWAAPVSIVCQEDLSQARVEIGSEAPAYLKDAEQISEARVKDHDDTVQRAIGFLLG